MSQQTPTPKVTEAATAAATAVAAVAAVSKQQKWINKVEAIDTELNSMSTVHQVHSDIQQDMRYAKEQWQTARQISHQAKEWVQYWQKRSRLLTAKDALMHKLKQSKTKTNYLPCKFSCHGCQASMSNEKNFVSHCSNCTYNPNTTKIIVAAAKQTFEAGKGKPLLTLDELATVAAASLPVLTTANAVAATTTDRAAAAVAAAKAPVVDSKREKKKKPKQFALSAAGNKDQQSVQDLLVQHERLRNQKRPATPTPPSSCCRSSLVKRRRVARCDPALRGNTLDGSYWQC